MRNYRVRLWLGIALLAAALTASRNGEAQARTPKTSPPGRLHGPLAPLVADRYAGHLRCREHARPSYGVDKLGRPPYRFCYAGKQQGPEPRLSVYADDEWLLVWVYETTPTPVGSDSARYEQLRASLDTRLGRSRACADNSYQWTRRGWWARLSTPIQPMVEGEVSGPIYAEIGFEAKLVRRGASVPLCPER